MDNSFILCDQLDLYEIELLKKSWDQLPDKDELSINITKLIEIFSSNFFYILSVGIRIMIKMFKSDTDIKYLWIFASNLETEEKMRNNSEIIYHAKKMTVTIKKLLD